MCEKAGEVKSVDMVQPYRQQRILSGHHQCWVADWMRHSWTRMLNGLAGVEGKQLKAGGKAGKRSQQ